MNAPPLARIEPARFDDLADAPQERGDTPRPAARRRRAFGVFGAALGAAALGYAGYAWATGERFVSTDNAYVGAEVAQVTPLVAGTVAEVRVVDTQWVRRGDVLVRLDPSDARIALAEAEAELARAERRVRQTIATSGSLSSQVATRRAEIGRAQASVDRARADLARARVDLGRREALATDGGVSGDELTSSRNAFSTATAALAAAQAELAQARSTRGTAEGQLAANEALVSGTTVGTNPEVLAARARLERVRLDLAAR